MNTLSAVILFWAIMCLAGWLLMAIDKAKAKRDAWRIPERTLMSVAFCMGGIGVYAGMFCFHHKTKHTKFRVGVPIAVICNIAVLLLAYTYLPA